MQAQMEKATGTEIYQFVKAEVEKHRKLCEDYVMEGSPLESSKYWFFVTWYATELRVSKVYTEGLGHKLERKMDNKWEVIEYLF